MPASNYPPGREPAEERLRGASSGDLTMCHLCLKDKVLPFLIKALGPVEAAAMNGISTGHGIGRAALMSLTTAAARIRQAARREGRGLSPAELSLSLQATAAAQEVATAAARRQPCRIAGRGRVQGPGAEDVRQTPLERRRRQVARRPVPPLRHAEPHHPSPRLGGVGAVRAGEGQASLWGCNCLCPVTETAVSSPSQMAPPAVPAPAREGCFVSPTTRTAGRNETRRGVRVASGE